MVIADYLMSELPLSRQRETPRHFLTPVAAINASHSVESAITK